MPLFPVKILLPCLSVAFLFPKLLVCFLHFSSKSVQLVTCISLISSSIGSIVPNREPLAILSYLLDVFKIGR